MSTIPPRSRSSAARDPKLARRVALISAFLIIPHLCAAQTVTAAGDVAPTPTPTPTPVPTPDDSSPAPLTERERAMLELIKGLHERVTRLEAQVSGAEE